MYFQPCENLESALTEGLDKFTSSETLQIIAEVSIYKPGWVTVLSNLSSNYTESFSLQFLNRATPLVLEAVNGDGMTTMSTQENLTSRRSSTR